MHQTQELSTPTATLTDSRPGARAWSALIILCFVYVLNFLDRQLLSILAKPIQDDLGITDGQLGLIGGFYFALFYCVLAIPVGWLADRTNRVRVLSFACALWSAATVACGLSTTYAQLAIARMSVGIGEAGGVPPSYAIVSDYFPPGTRGTALSIYNLGPPIGLALGVAFGASILGKGGKRLGAVDGLLVDAGTKRATSVVVDEGLFDSAKHMIGVSSIARSDQDGLHLQESAARTES